MDQFLLPSWNGLRQAARKGVFQKRQYILGGGGVAAHAAEELHRSASVQRQPYIVHHLAGTQFHHRECLGIPGQVSNLLRREREPVSYTHLRAHETDSYLVCRL